MTLKLTSKFRSGRNTRSHRFDKLEDADATESSAPLDSFNTTANLPATTPDPYDRSCAASRSSTVRRPAATFQSLTFSDVQQLTNVLSHAPSPAISWQSPMWATYARFTRQQIENLPAHLRCKSNSPFSSRFWTNSGSKLTTSDVGEGGLCKLHSQLNVDLVRSIFAFLQKEIEDIPAFLDPLSDAGRLTRQHEDVMNALSAVPALWTAAPLKSQETPNDGPFRDIRRRLGRRDSMMSPNNTPRMYSMASSLQSSLSLSTSASMSKLLAMSASAPTQFHKRSCLACAIAQVGSSPAIVFALRVGILARSQIEPNRRGVRITFVECWMEHLHSASENGQEVERIMRESFELGMQLRGLYRRLSIEKERLRIEDSEEPVDMTIRESKKASTGFWVDLGHKANCAWPFKTRGRGSNISLFDLARSQSSAQRSVKPRGRSSNLSMFDLARSQSTHREHSNLTKQSSTSRLRSIRAYSSSQLKPRPKTSYTSARRSQSVSSHHRGGRHDTSLRPKTSFFHASSTMPFLPRTLSRRKTHHALKTDSAALLSSPTLEASSSPPMAASTECLSKGTQTSPRASVSPFLLDPVPPTPPAKGPIIPVPLRTSSRAPLDAYAWKTLPPLPPQHRVRKRRHLSLPDALTMTTPAHAHSQHKPHHQHNRSHHLHPRHHLQQRGGGGGLADATREGLAVPQGPQMHVHPALRTRSPVYDRSGEGDGVVGGGAGKARPDLSLFPRAVGEGKPRRRGTSKGGGTGVAVSRRAAKDGAWGCAVMKEMGI